VDYLTAAINGHQQNAPTYDHLENRLRFQFLRKELGPDGEFDQILFTDEAFVLSPQCHKEYVERVLLRHMVKEDPNTLELRKKVMNWEALRGKSYEVARKQLAEDFYKDEMLTFTPRGARTLLHSLGYLDLED